MQPPILGKRLLEITESLLNLEENNARIIMGRTDDIKLKSSMTLFYLVSQNLIFKKVINKFFEGKMDNKTIKIIEDMKTQCTDPFI